VAIQIQILRIFCVTSVTNIVIVLFQSSIESAFRTPSLGNTKIFRIKSSRPN